MGTRRFIPGFKEEAVRLQANCPQSVHEPDRCPDQRGVSFLSRQRPSMKLHVITDEARDKVVAVIVALPKPQYQRMASYPA